MELYLGVNGYYYENIFTEKTKKIIKEILNDELIYQKKDYPWIYENTLITYSNEYSSDHWSLKLADLAEELNKICFPCPSIVRPGYSLWSYSIFLRRLGASENIFLRKQDFFKNDFLMSCSSY